MSKNLRKCMKAMHIYCCTDSKKMKKSILEEMSKSECFFDAMHEVVNNILLKNVKMTSADRRKAKHFIKIMNKIHRCPKKKFIKKKLVKQSGGFIQFILPILTSVISEVIQNAISKKSDTSST